MQSDAVLDSGSPKRHCFELYLKKNETTSFSILVKTKLYDVISVCKTSGTTTQELFSPRQRRQKLVKTIFHMHEKMDLFFFCKMTH